VKLLKAKEMTGKYAGGYGIASRFTLSYLPSFL